MSLNHPEGVAPGFGPESVAGVREALSAVSHFSLLRGLTSGGEDDFVLRFAVVADLVYAEQTLWTLDGLHRRLCWLQADRVLPVLRSLRRAGWIEAVGVQYRLTNSGLAVYATISRLSSLHTGREDDLALGVFDLEASTRTGEDQGPALRHLQHHLRRSIEEVEAAVDSMSELKVLDARAKLERNLQWSRRARELLDEMDVEDEAGYRTGQRVGRDLSELHRWHSVVQRSLDALDRKRVPLGALGVNQADVDRYLAGLETDQLLDLAQSTVSEPVWPQLLILDNLMNVAEYELLMSEYSEHRTVGWSDDVAASAEVGAPPPDAGEMIHRQYDQDVDRVHAEGQTVKLERFLIRGDFAQTCYRLSLLALEDDANDGRVRVERDPGGGREVFSDFVSELSPARVIPRTVAA